tara:strand:- start:327 stop:818 length:492 start_codon:yes stop_codon:yes gene_type:complete
MTINELFQHGMDRHLPELIPVNGEVILNLGAGNKLISGTIPLDYPGWDGETDDLPFDDEGVDHIFAFHFFEHLNNPVRCLYDCQRVLKPNGTLNIVVPYYTSQIAYQDLDHKKFFCVETWRTLFRNPYYDKNSLEWEFEIGLNVIIGVVERNLALMTQLIKKG